MLANIIKSIFILILVVSCKSIDNVEIKSSGGNKDSIRCNLLQNAVDINPVLFEPFDSVYQAFNESSSNLAVITRTIGQKSGVTRLYQLEENTTFRLMRFNEKGLLKDTILKIEPLTLDKISSDYAFHCNQNSTHLGTQVYILKKGNNIISNMWFENGDFWDLSKGDIDEYENLGKLFKLLDID